MARGGFTSRELLVVVVAICVVAAMVVPADDLARRRAKDFSCASVMRRSLLGVALFNEDHPGGLWNHMPKCPYWGKQWQYPWTDTPHALYDGGTHMWAEGRSQGSYWRGYLLDGGYADVGVLGCSYASYEEKPFYSSYNTHQGDQKATFDSVDFRRRPAFVWYGPGSYSADNVSDYSGGNLMGRLEGPAGDYRSKGPLLTCPQVCTVLAVVKQFEPSHRPEWSKGEVTPFKLMPYAENVGFSDGSVKFYENENGGTFEPK